jgi:hypothetical protein
VGNNEFSCLLQGAIARGDLNAITVTVVNSEKTPRTKIHAGVSTMNKKKLKAMNKNRHEAYQIFIFFWATKDYNTLTGMGTIASTCLYNTAKTASNFGHNRT